MTEDDAVGAVVSVDELVGLAESMPLRRVMTDSRAVVTAHPECSVVAAISSWAFIRAAEWASRSRADRSWLRYGEMQYCEDLGRGGSR